MLFDYGIFFSKKTNICLLNTKFIVTFKQNITISDVSLRVKGDHEVVHRNILEDGAQRDYKTCVFRNPNNILKRRSNRLKENLKTFITFKTKGKVNFKDFVDQKNLKIQKIVNKDRTEWKYLLKRDVDLFIYLSKYLKIDAYKLFGLYSEEYEICDNKKNVQKLIKLLSTNVNVLMDQELRKRHILDFFKKKSNMYIAMMIHLDFCVLKKHKSTISHMDEEYKRMLEYIFLRDLSNKISRINIDHPLYHEIILFNQFLENKPLDPSQLPLTTINERGIKYFIMECKDYKHE